MPDAGDRAMASRAGAVFEGGFEDGVAEPLDQQSVTSRAVGVLMGADASYVFP